MKKFNFYHKETWDRTVVEAMTKQDAIKKLKQDSKIKIKDYIIDDPTRRKKSYDVRSFSQFEMDEFKNR